jgi:hypothetical protein
MISAFWAGGAAAVAAETVTLPFDIVKVRLQVQLRSESRGMLNTMSWIIRKEGPRALFKGIQPALLRQWVYTSVTMACYEPLKDVWVKSNQGGIGSFASKCLMGGTAGALGILVANPTEVVKVGLQADTEGLFKGPIDALLKIFKSQGITGLYRGLVPNVQRAFIVNAAELGTYDHCKNWLIHDLGLSNDLPAHAGASVLAGFASVLCSNPVDVVKTRLMAQSSSVAIGSVSKYKGMLDCLQKTIASEGVVALYQGFIPNWFRKGPFCLVFFICYENLKK